jgi:hypothetical protein
VCLLQSCRCLMQTTEVLHVFKHNLQYTMLKFFSDEMEITGLGHVTVNVI